MRVGTIGSGFIVRYILENIAKTEGICCEAVYSRKMETGKRKPDKRIFDFFFFPVIGIYTVACGILF